MSSGPLGAARRCFPDRGTAGSTRCCMNWLRDARLSYWPLETPTIMLTSSFARRRRRNSRSWCSVSREGRRTRGITPPSKRVDWSGRTGTGPRVCPPVACPAFDAMSAISVVDISSCACLSPGNSRFSETQSADPAPSRTSPFEAARRPSTSYSPRRSAVAFDAAEPPRDAREPAPARPPPGPRPPPRPPPSRTTREAARRPSTSYSPRRSAVAFDAAEPPRGAREPARVTPPRSPRSARCTSSSRARRSRKPAQRGRVRGSPRGTPAQLARPRRRARRTRVAPARCRR